MTNNCILTELKSNRRLKVWLLFTLLLISIFIVIVTTATQALASTVLLSNEKLTEKSQRISFTEVASKLILADQKRLADPKLFKKLLTELKTLGEFIKPFLLFTPKDTFLSSAPPLSKSWQDAQEIVLSLLSLFS